MNREIEAEIEALMAVEPSPAFLPGVRRRVARLKARRESAPRRWMVPALATLAGALVVSYFVADGTQESTNVASHPAAPVAPVLEEEPGSNPDLPAAAAPEAERPRLPASVPVTHPAPGTELTATPTAPSPTRGSEDPRARRVFVPPEDEQAVRRLVRRLRGHAAQVVVQVPEVAGPADLALEPVADPQEVVSIDHRVIRGADPRLEQPPSFDRVVGKAGRKT